MLFLEPNKQHIAGIRDLTEEWGHPATMSEIGAWVHELISSPYHQILVAVRESDVCGWIVVEKRIFLGAGFKSEVTALVVGSKYRRLGIGKDLLIHAEKWALKSGTTSLIVRSNAARVESHPFYENTGFKLTKTTHNYEKQLAQNLRN